MENKEILAEVEKLVRPYYHKLKLWGHGWKHILGVVKAAEVIAEIEGVDPVLCQVAAYCHDLGRIEEEEKNLVNTKPGSPSAHAVMSVEPTRKILAKVGITGQDAKDIVEAVQIHNIRKYEGPNQVALILQDADRADGFGQYSLLRFAVFNCGIDIDEPRDERHADELLDYVRSILKKDKAKRDRMIEAIEYAFSWVNDLANTATLKGYVTDGYMYNLNFYNEIKSY